MLLSNIEDKIAACYSEENTQFSDFMTMEEADTVQNFLREIGLNFSFWGGYDLAERRMVALSAGELSHDFQITVLCGTWDKFGSISHRDVLGAVMSCGIERKCIGDILLDPQNRKFYLFSVSRMSEYIMKNIDRIGRCSIIWNVVDNIETVPTAHVEEKSISIASLRIDNLIAAVFHLSRQKAQDLIDEKKVFINHTLVCKATHNILPGSSIVVKGMGKFMFLEQSGISKKGKLYILIKQFI